MDILILVLLIFNAILLLSLIMMVKAANKKLDKGISLYNYFIKSDKPRSLKISERSIPDPNDGSGCPKESQLQQ